jgi:hypothetical protein
LIPVPSEAGASGRRLTNATRKSLAAYVIACICAPVGSSGVISVIGLSSAVAPL